ncbi:DegT/DnrJ/EryC1/StrS family aminotransferase [Ottowia sp.]|uniref:DegT/DnrJ/EryC1/StrS family aminotransferase n=1 Tax=Ottowia sp. TaxID=1898956 RepID=UPI002612F348|nr:DegT/DnrJ/EryC1/StrS family aminotransferase [Ottowia sp.]
MSQAMVPFFCASGANFGVDLGACIQDVVNSGQYVLGPQVQAFEASFARYLGVGCAVGVGNGTDALTLALRALGVGPGSRVLTVANAGCYASTAIAQAGAEPLYADVEPRHLTLSPTAVEVALESGPVAAVVLTHLYGQMGEVERIGSICESAGVPMIEDCAQAHGAARGGRKAGAWGRMGCFSFYPTKNLGALGDGGLVATNDRELAERVRALRQYGWRAKYEVVLAGGCNSRLDELQAAVLLAKLHHLDDANAARRAIAQRYNVAFADLPLELPASMNDDYVAHLYVVRTPRRSELQAYLTQHGVACAIHYPVSDHQQPVRVGQSPSLPATEAACAEVLSLPCCPGLSSPQVEQVILAVRGFFRG